MKDIGASLSGELAAVRELVWVLEREQAAIAEANLAAIEALTGKKAEIVRQLAHLGEQCRQALVARGFGPGSQGMEAWLRSDERGRSESAAWHEFKRMVEQAQKLNQTNHKLIHMRLTYTERAITALQDAAAVSLLTYSPDGRRTPATGQARVVARR